MYHDDAALSMEAGDLEQVLGTLRQQALDIEAQYCDQVLTTTNAFVGPPPGTPPTPHARGSIKCCQSQRSISSQDIDGPRR
jgi:hypothetical protein